MASHPVHIAYVYAYDIEADTPDEAVDALIEMQETGRAPVGELVSMHVTSALIEASHAFVITHAPSGDEAEADTFDGAYLAAKTLCEDNGGGTATIAWIDRMVFVP